MTLNDLKEEYKKSIRIEKIESKKDYKQLIQEIDDADTLNEFIKVVELWTKININESASEIILRRIIEKEEIKKNENTIFQADVRVIASFLKVELTEEETQEILERYPDEQEQDPTGTWNLVVENIIHQVVSNRK